MRDGPAPRWMQHVLPALAIFGLVLALLSCVGCATVRDCEGFVRKNVAGVECSFCLSGPGC